MPVPSAMSLCRTRLPGAGASVERAADRTLRGLSLPRCRERAAGGGDDVSIGPLDGAALVAFLGQPWNARIATVDADGWPHVTPVWYDFEPDTRTFLVVGRE